MEDEYDSGTSCECHDSLSADEENTLKKRKASTSIKKWNERNTALLIYLLEERPSLWDMFGSEYTKRKVREVAYKEIAEKLGENWTLSEIKGKINNLRAQIVRELKKTKKTKSGESRDEEYRSTWAHWEKMQFLVPQLKLGSTADTIALQDKDFDKKIQSREINNDNEEEVAPKAKRKSFA